MHSLLCTLLVSAIPAVFGHRGADNDDFMTSEADALGLSLKPPLDNPGTRTCLRDGQPQAYGTSGPFTMVAIAGTGDQRRKRAKAVMSALPNVESVSTKEWCDSCWECSDVSLSRREVAIPFNSYLNSEFSDVSGVCVVEKLRIEPTDTLLITGHLMGEQSTKNSLKKRVADIFEETSSSASIYIQAPGFNLRGEALLFFSKQFPDAEYIFGANCPSYAFTIFKDLIDSYGEVATGIFSSALAGMWTSRFDGSFNRQFFSQAFRDSTPEEAADLYVKREREGRFQIPSDDVFSDEEDKTANRMKRKRIEFDIAYRFQEYVQDNFPEDRAAAKAVVDALEEVNKSGFDFAMRLSKEWSPGWEATWEAWTGKVDAATTPHLMEPLAHVILLYFSDLEKESGQEFFVNEYNGFATHTMLLQKAGHERKPSREEHLALMQWALGKTNRTDGFQLDALTQGAGIMQQAGRLFVMHNLGLDIVVSNYLQSKILLAVWKHLETSKWKISTGKILEPKSSKLDVKRHRDELQPERKDRTCVRDGQIRTYGASALFTAVAISGDDARRMKRAKAVMQEFPDVESVSAKEWCDMCWDCGEKRFSIPFNMYLNSDFSDVSGVCVVDQLRIGPADTVLVAGHVTANKGESAIETISNIFGGSSSHASIYTQAPGFNINGDSLLAFSKQFPNAEYVSGGECPGYPFSVLKDLWPSYGEVTRAVLATGFAGMWSSRFDASFNRQFFSQAYKSFSTEKAKELYSKYKEAGRFQVPTDEVFDEANDKKANQLRLKRIEFGIATRLYEQLKTYPKEDLAAAKAVVDALEEVNNSGFDFAMETTVSCEDDPGWKAVWGAWYGKVDAATTPHLMLPLAQVMLTFFSDLEKESGHEFFVNEYDGFSAHAMLLKKAGENRLPSSKEHLALMQWALGRTNRTDGFQMDALTKAAKNIQQDGRLFVLHDFGLDPMCDDSIELNILVRVFQQAGLGARAGYTASPPMRYVKKNGNASVNVTVDVNVSATRG